MGAQLDISLCGSGGSDRIVKPDYSRSFDGATLAVVDRAANGAGDFVSGGVGTANVEGPSEREGAHAHETETGQSASRPPHGFTREVGSQR